MIAKISNGYLQNIQHGSDGNYSMSGFIPGEYEVVYTWGNEEYPVQKYKSTIVYKDSYDTKAGINGKTKDDKWYEDKFKQKYIGQEWDQTKKQEIRTSDAVDNYEERESIDGEKTIITNATSKNDESIKINSTTPTFKIDIESYEGSLKTEEEFSKKWNGTIDFTKRKDEYKNKVKSIDFGIALRPQQRLALEKQIKRARILLANGFELAKVERDAEGNITDSPYVVYLDENSSGGRGQIKFEVDSEIIQGARLDIVYQFVVSNLSEKDYRNKQFYNYGKGYGDKKSDEITMPTLDAKQVIDYLDNNILLSEKDEKWSVIDKNKLQKMRTEEGLLENNNDMKTFLEKCNSVITTGELSKKLKPGDTNAIELNCVCHEKVDYNV